MVLRLRPLRLPRVACSVLGVVSTLLTAGSMQTTVASPSFELLWPVDCHYRQSCYIQYYPDTLSDERVADYQGGHLSYDGHDGTDIGLANFLSINQSVAVLAAASGVVIATRDGEVDHTAQKQPFTEGRECGNGVLIDHGGGWTTQYCHLKRGSVRVSKGQQLAAGDPLAEIGASGMADFAHLHLTVMKDTQPIDPFSASLWRNPVPYQRTGLIDWGFGDQDITSELAEQGVLPQTHTPETAQHILGWARIYGVRAGDKERFWFIRPNGEAASPPTEQTISRDYRVWFSFAGFPKSAQDYGEGWRYIYQYRPADSRQWHTLIDERFVVR